MTTATAAIAAITARITANFTAMPVTFQGDQPLQLPARPVAFAFVETIIDGSDIVGFGGGRFDSLHRNTGRIIGHIFVPMGHGQSVALGHAETLAALFRSYRDNDISCFSAMVRPAGQDDSDGRYFRAEVVIEFHFDQTG